MLKQEGIDINNQESDEGQLLFKLKLYLEGGKLDQLVKCLLSKHRDLNSDQHLQKSWPQLWASIILVLARQTGS